MTPTEIHAIMQHPINAEINFRLLNRPTLHDLIHQVEP